MKTILKLALVLVLQSAAAQKMNLSVSFSVKADTLKQRVYTVPKEGKDEFEVQTLVIPMHYGDDRILNKKAVEVLNGGANIISVDLVYTVFPHPHEFIDVNKLNKKRLAELYFQAPDVFSQSMTKWSLIEQLGYSNEDQARKLFHGLVIRFVKATPYKPESEEAMKERIAKKSKCPGDTTVLSVFSRNPKMGKDIIAVDMTGSMSPYYDQVFVWFYLKKITDPTHFAFFNDGDATPDHVKKIGNTGGVYLFTANKMDTLVKYAFMSLLGGYGGDTPENNVEAILKAIKKYPEAKEVVMIADNWADMRDFSLLSKIDRPVHVILCGTNPLGAITVPLNMQYLELARATKGSIHTMTEDLNDLAKASEGEKFELMGVKFMIKGGRIMRI